MGKILREMKVVREFYTTSEVCRMLGVCGDTVRKWVHSGALKATFLPRASDSYDENGNIIPPSKRRYHIRASDLEAFLLSGDVKIKNASPKT